jgi:hypothetical protein
MSLGLTHLLQPETLFVESTSEPVLWTAVKTRMPAIMPLSSTLCLAGGYTGAPIVWFVITLLLPGRAYYNAFTFNNLLYNFTWEYSLFLLLVLPGYSVCGREDRTAMSCLVGLLLWLLPFLSC